MKKKTKILAASLLAFVMSGAVVTAGTYALFSDTVENSVVINTGNIKVTSADSILSWKNSETEYEAAKDPKSVTFGVDRSAQLENGTLTLNGVLPGDGVQYKVAYTNQSTISFKYRLRLVVSEELKGYFDITTKVGEGEETLHEESAVLQSWKEGNADTTFDDVVIKVEYKEDVAELATLKDASVKLVLDVVQFETETAPTIGEGYEYETLEDALEDTSVDTFEVASIPDLETGSLTINRPITLRGVPGNVIKVNSGDSIIVQGATSSAEAPVVIEDLNFVIEESATVTNAITVTNDNVTIKNCTFTSTYEMGDSEVTRAVVVSPGQENVNFINNKVSHLRQPGYFEGTSGLISGNEVSYSRGFVITHNSNYVIENNIFENNATDIAIIDGTNDQTAQSSNYDGKEAEISKANGGCYVDNQINGVDAVDGTTDVEILDPSKLQQGNNLTKDNAFYYIPAGNYDMPYGLRIEGTDADAIENVRVLGAGDGTVLNFTGWSTNGFSGVEINGNVSGISFENMKLLSSTTRSNSSAPLSALKAEGLNYTGNDYKGITVSNCYIDYANVHGCATDENGDFTNFVTFNDCVFNADRWYGALAVASAKVNVVNSTVSDLSKMTNYFTINWKDDDEELYPNISEVTFDNSDFYAAVAQQTTREGLNGAYAATFTYVNMEDNLNGKETWTAEDNLGFIGFGTEEFANLAKSLF